MVYLFEADLADHALPRRSAIRPPGSVARPGTLRAPSTVRTLVRSDVSGVRKLMAGVGDQPAWRSRDLASARNIMLKAPVRRAARRRRPRQVVECAPRARAASGSAGRPGATGARHHAAGHHALNRQPDPADDHRDPAQFAMTACRRQVLLEISSVLSLGRRTATPGSPRCGGT